MTHTPPLDKGWRRVARVSARLSAAGIGTALLLALFVTQTLGGTTAGDSNRSGGTRSNSLSLLAGGSESRSQDTLRSASSPSPGTASPTATPEGAAAEGAISVEDVEAVKAAPERTSRFELPLARWFMVTDRYGAPRGKGVVHGGIDLALDGLPRSTVVVACEGAVASTGYSAIYGNHVIVDCGEEWSTLYGHLSQVDVVKGQVVRFGDGVGLSGSTGVSSGEHLHFEIRWRGWAVNPEKYLDFHIAPGAPLTYDLRDENGDLITGPTVTPTPTPTATPTPDFNIVPIWLRPTPTPTRTPTPAPTATPTPVTPTATPTLTPRPGLPGG